MKLRQVLFLAAIGSVICGRVHAQATSGAFSSAAPIKSALLIGIGTYTHPSAEIRVPEGVPRTGRYEPELTYIDLKGPVHDVDAMREVLTSEKFGFPNDDKHVHILKDQAATHDAILKAMQQYLVTDPNPGDTVVLFISSHGSLRADPKGRGQLYDLDGTGLHPSAVENTIVPYDWYLGQNDIFSRDLRHIFNQAADRGIHLTAIFDTCHSGSLARGEVNSALVARDFDFDPRPMPADPYPAEAVGTPPETRPDNPVLVLSAAQKDQSALENKYGVPPYGLFTNALIETLEALPANRPAADVFKRLQVALEIAKLATNQRPELDTSTARRQQPLFGGAAGSGPPTAAIVSVDGNALVLDIGAIADIGPGSEFTELTESNGVRAILRVSDSIGLARSAASVISPAGTSVHAKDIVQLTKWVPAQRPTLSFYAGASNPSFAEIQEAVTVLHSANIKFAADPSTDPWSHHVVWDGAHWIVYAHSRKISADKIRKENPVTLGAKLSLAALKKLPSVSIVWFDSPLPRESVQALLAPPVDGGPPSAALLTLDRNQADYVLAGTPTDTGIIRYAWFKRGDVDAEVQTPRGIGAGCSPNSPYPLRTEWVVADKTAPPEIALSNAAAQLARLNGWLRLASSSLSGHADFPYQLSLRRVSEIQDVVDGGNTYKGDYELALVRSGTVAAAPRWVYVLSIDCQGRGSLLWPYEGFPAGRFPTEKGKLDRIPLPGEPFPVGDPLGTDTYILLTTSTPLGADGSALEFTGVVTRDGKSARGSTGPLDPLEDLLNSTSAGTRAGNARPTPTNWSVQPLQTYSLPGPPPIPANSTPH